MPQEHECCDLRRLKACLRQETISLCRGERGYWKKWRGSYQPNCFGRHGKVWEGGGQTRGSKRGVNYPLGGGVEKLTGRDPEVTKPSIIWRSYDGGELITQPKECKRDPPATSVNPSDRRRRTSTNQKTTKQQISNKKKEEERWGKRRTRWRRIGNQEERWEISKEYVGDVVSLLGSKMKIPVGGAICGGKKEGESPSRKNG